jgi:hypothetical protein
VFRACLPKLHTCDFSPPSSNRAPTSSPARGLSRPSLSACRRHGRRRAGHGGIRADRRRLTGIGHEPGLHVLRECPRDGALRHSGNRVAHRNGDQYRHGLQPEHRGRAPRRGELPHGVDDAGHDRRPADTGQRTELGEDDADLVQRLRPATELLVRPRLPAPRCDRHNGSGAVDDPLPRRFLQRFRDGLPPERPARGSPVQHERGREQLHGARRRAGLGSHGDQPARDDPHRPAARARARAGRPRPTEDLDADRDEQRRPCDGAERDRRLASGGTRVPRLWRRRQHDQSGGDLSVPGGTPGHTSSIRVHPRSPQE